MKFNYLRDDRMLITTHSGPEEYHRLVLDPVALMLVYAAMLNGLYSVGSSMLWTDHELLILSSEYDRVYNEFLEPLDLNIASEAIYCRGNKCGDVG